MPAEVIEACVIPDRRELPPVPGVRYAAFVDPSGGSQDSMTFALAHAAANDTVVLDLLRERKPPFSPDGGRAVRRAVPDLRVTTVSGDRYGGGMAARAVPDARHRVQGRGADEVGTLPRNAAAPDRPAGGAARPASPARPARSLERRTGRAPGRDSIDHPPGAHDDVANAAAGALVLAGTRGRPMFSEYAAPSGAGGRPTWSAAEIRWYAREAGAEFLGWGGWPR